MKNIIKKWCFWLIIILLIVGTVIAVVFLNKDSESKEDKDETSYKDKIKGTWYFYNEEYEAMYSFIFEKDGNCHVSIENDNSTECTYKITSSKITIKNSEDVEVISGKYEFKGKSKLVIDDITLYNSYSEAKENPAKDNLKSVAENANNSRGYSTSSFKEITAKKISSESKNKTIVVMIGRQGCTYCAQYAPVLAEVAKDLDFKVRYIDFAKIIDLDEGIISDEEAYDTIRNLDAVSEFEGAGEEALQGTPATLIIKDNVIQYYIRGAADEDTIRDVFKEFDID